MFVHGKSYVSDRKESNMADFIILAVVFVILTVSICYIIKEKKRGVKCIGCPFSDTCSSKQQDGESCSSNCQES